MISDEFLNPSSGVIFKNIVFKNAYGETFGGAIRIDENINCKIENCTFIQNNAENGGAAIYFNSIESLEIKDSTFRNNKALYSKVVKHHGGAVLAYKGSFS